jgi:hypothetical protein
VNKNTFLKLIVFSFFIASLAFIYPKKIKSAAISNVKDVLCTSQFSYMGEVGAGNVAGSSVLYLNTGGTAPSLSSNNLFVGDTIFVGSLGSTYVVTDIGSSGDIRVSPALGAGDITAGGRIMHPVSSCHTVSFDVIPSLAGEVWEFLLKASTASNSADGIPDHDGFDRGTLAPNNVTCPFGVTASVGTTTSLAMGSPPVPSYYHVIKCTLTTDHNPAVGETATIIIGNTDNTNSFINPSPSHAGGNDIEGYPEILPYAIRHTTSTGTILDQTIGNVAIIEAVRVTATIDPSITFWIDNVGVTDPNTTFPAISGTDDQLDSGAVNTTADQVIFGSLAIQEINQLAQHLNAVTNAAGGYVVTAYEAGPMTRIGGVETIPDTLCNNAGCTITAAQPWVGFDDDRSEFGYTMISAGSSIPFVEGDFKPFGIGCDQAQPVMVNPSVPSTIESAYAIYRITATTVQAAGDYEAKIIYTATSTF